MIAHIRASYVFLTFVIFQLGFVITLQGQNDFDPPDLEFNYLDRGLSQNRITCIFQDHQGYMWFGTESGLNRYNGSEFKIFDYFRADSTSISGSWITDIIEDHNNELWISSHSGGVSRFNQNDETFEHWKKIKGDSTSLINNNISVLLEDSKNNIWLGTFDGLSLLNPQRTYFKRIGGPNSADSLLNQNVTEHMKIEKKEYGLV